MNLANFFNFLDTLKSLEKDSSVFILFLYIAITQHIDDTKKHLATLWFGFIFIIFLFANIFVNQKEFDCYITLNGKELANKEIIINGEEFTTNEYGIVNINKNFLYSTIAIPNEDNIYYKWKKNENSNTKYNLFIYYIPDFIAVKNKKYFDVDIDRCSNIEIEMYNKKYGKIYFDESSVHSIQIGNIDVKYIRKNIDLLNTMSIPLPQNILPGIFYLNVNLNHNNKLLKVNGLRINVTENINLSTLNKKNILWPLSKNKKAELKPYSDNKKYIEFITNPNGFITLTIPDRDDFTKIVELDFLSSEHLSSPHICINNILFTIGGDYGETIVMHKMNSSYTRIGSEYRKLKNKLSLNEWHTIKVETKKENAMLIFHIMILNEDHELVESIEPFCVDVNEIVIKNYIGIGSTYTHTNSKSVNSSVKIKRISII